MSAVDPFAFLEYSLGVQDVFHVIQGISRQQDQVGQLALLQASQFLLDTQDARILDENKLDIYNAITIPRSSISILTSDLNIPRFIS